ncbi:MAG: MATE family efflux transporter [Candidatus Amulumruptor caecigallinarius]|nr:MATE family efflux transporter [Candidatus Amulumruptor caecigallinarius]
MNLSPTLFKTYRHEYAELTKLGFPVLLTQLGVILVSFADTMMVGAYGVNELAAAAFVNSVFLIPMVMLMGLASGVTPLVGALFAMKRGDDAGKTVRAALQINSIAAVCFTLLMTGVFFILDKFGQPYEILPAARQYFITLLFTILPMSLFNVFTQTCNGVTDTRSPMWFVLLMVGVNILLNWLLIFGNCGFPELGLLGAGIATAVARIVGLAGICILFLCSRRYAPYKDGIFKPIAAGVLRRKVWNTSYPIMLQTGIECSLWSFGAVVCGWYGKIQLAAYQVVNTIGQLGFMTYMSFGVAVAVKVANYCGLGDERGAGRCARAGLHLNFMLATLASLVFILLNRHMLAWFTPDVGVIAAAVSFIPPLVLYQYADAAQLTLINAIRGTSQVRPLLWIALTGYVAVGVPVLLVFAEVLNWQSVGVYYSFCVALLATSLYAYVVFRRTHIPPQSPQLSQSA